MSKGTRTCKVCGKQYEYCKTNRPTGTFRWQDVACSPEHGSIYFERIAASRSQKASKQEATPVMIAPAEKVKPVKVEAEPESVTVEVEEVNFISSATESEIFAPNDGEVLDGWADDDEDDWFDEDEDEDDWFFDDDDDWFDNDEEEDGEDAFVFGGELSSDEI